VVVAHSATLELNERLAELRRSGRPVLHLGFGEAGLPVLPELLEHLRTAAPQNAYASVAGAEPAREAAAGYWTRRGLPTSPDQIVFAPGSKALLYAVLAVLDGDVVLPQPSWVTYAAQAALTGKRVIPVPVPAGCGGVPDPDLLEDVLRTARPRVLVLTLPDNPTGTHAPAETVRRVCELAERHDLVILSDEIYRDLVHDGSEFTSPAAWLPDRTIVSAGLSKNLALGGWRIGFLRLPTQAWREALLGVASEIWSSISTPMQAVAEYALSDPEPVRARIAASRRLHGTVATAVYDAFAAAGAVTRKPDAGFYLYPDFEPLRPELTKLGIDTGAALAGHLLDRHGVAVLRGDAFGDHPQALRFRVATSLLYGTTDDERLTALASDAPLDLPWIKASLDQLSTSLAFIGHKRRHRSATVNRSPPGAVTCDQ
jgi:aspartate aminotransferase